jgi:hypothetical protein
MREPIARLAIVDRTRFPEVVPTAAQWVCCVCAFSASPFAWHGAVYQFARAQAIAATRDEEIRRWQGQWN